MHTYELKYRMPWSGTIYNIIIKKVTKYKIKLKLRNQTSVWTDKFRNVMKLLKCLEKSHKPFENDKKMKVATSKLQLKNLFWPYPARRSVLWWQPSYQKMKEIIKWMTDYIKLIFLLLIASISTFKYSHHKPRAIQLWILIMYVIYASYSRDFQS